MLSKAFTTTRALELEYRRLTLLRESGAEVESFITRMVEGEQQPLIAELAFFAGAIWQ
jgi:hypothetical protein